MPATEPSTRPDAITRMSRWLMLHRFAAIAIVAATTLRCWAAMTGEIARFADSTGWLTPGPWTHSNRFGPVPFVLQLAGKDEARVLVQAVVGAVAWSALAATLASSSRVPRVVLTAVLTVALTPQVIRYDVAILSESLGISFAVLAAAATVRLMRVGDAATWATWAMTVVLCGLTRPTHLVVLAIATAASIVIGVRSRRKLHLAVGIAMSASLVMGLVLLHGNRGTSELNIYTVLAADILPNDARTAWFVEAGMPVVAGMRDAGGYEDPATLPADVRHALALPVDQLAPSLVRAGGMPLLRWVQDDGAATYARFLITHPGDTVDRLGDVAASVLSPAHDDFLPLSTPALVPRSVFGAWTWWVAAFAVAELAMVASRKRREAAMLLATAATTAALFAGSMLWSGLERPRHAVTAAVLVRVLALTAVAVATGPSRRLGVKREKVPNIVEPKPACRASSDV